MSASSRWAAASVKTLRSSFCARSIATPMGVALPGETRALVRPVVGGHQVEAGQVGDRHDAIDIRREVGIDAVAIAAVVEDAEAPVGGHAPEAQLADVPVARLAPGTAHPDASLVSKLLGP